jgi:hypothetical protein
MNTSQTKNKRSSHDAAGDAHRAGLQAGQECLLAALDYRERGWSVLAVCPPDHVGVGRKHGQNCTHPGKSPWGPWKVFQTRLPTLEELHQKWQANPQLNVGMTLGGITGLIGLDVDGNSGEEVLGRLSRGDLPPTLEFTSGKGRRLLYRVPPGLTLRPTPRPGGLEVEGGELRLLGLGSQTVMPPSRHQQSGRRYAWVPGRASGEIEPVVAPAWVVELMRSDRPEARGRTHSFGEGQRILEGHRDSMLTSWAGSMRQRGMSVKSIRAALQIENETRCVPPLPKAQVEKIARSIERYEPGPLSGGSVRAPGRRAHTIVLSIPWGGTP